MKVPFSEGSNEYQLHELCIDMTIKDIKSGHGCYEIEMGKAKECADIFENEDDVEFFSEKLALVPLRYFNSYIKNGHYPHPRLLEYFSEVFEQVLEGTSLTKAFGLSRPRGRPAENDQSEASIRKQYAGMSVDSLVRNQEMKVIEAIRKVSKQYHMGEKTIRRAYDEAKKEYERGAALARKHNSGEPQE